jgi:hypothetical protein
MGQPCVMKLAPAMRAADATEAAALLKRREGMHVRVRGSCDDLRSTIFAMPMISVSTMSRSPVPMGAISGLRPTRSSA